VLGWDAMEYVVYGAGAVGGVVGGLLHAAGRPVTLVARGAHLEALRSSGLVVRRPRGTVTVATPVAGGAAEVDWSRRPTVLLAVKSQQTEAAVADLAAYAPPGTPVVSLQNGVSNERTLLRSFAHVYAVCVMLPCSHLEPGVVEVHKDPVPGLLDIGRYPDGTDEVATAVAADLRAAGFHSEVRADVMAWKHRKLLLNLGNAVEACFEPSEAAARLLALVREEGERVLVAAGAPLVSAEADRVRRGDLLQGTRDGGGGSTWQSLRRGTGDVEVDHLNGEIVLLGRLHGVPAPANELLRRAALDLARRHGPVASLDAAELLARLE
jgi:2-dehydropantoate 2-reductase